MTIETTVPVGDFMITTLAPGTKGTANCYLVFHSLSGEQALIDPSGDAAAIVQAVLEGGGRLNHILLTHAHYDHVGAVAAVCRHFGLACAVHQGDARLLRQAPLYALRFARLEIEQPEPFLAFDDPPGWDIGPQSIRVIHTPGHTAGSVCYRLPGLAFTGDTLMRQRVGRTDLPGGDATQLKRSIDLLLSGLPDDTLVLPGHGHPWTIGEARRWWTTAAAAPPVSLPVDD